MLDFDSLLISDHFIVKCAERAPQFVRAKKGGGFELETERLKHAITTAEEIVRFKTITRLLKYGDKTKYYHYKYTSLKNQVIFVIENNKIITVYPFKDSWANLK